MREYRVNITGEESLWARALIRVADGRLPKRVMFGKINDGVKKGRGGQEKATCMRGKRHPIFQVSTKLVTHSPGSLELDRTSNGGRAEL